MTVAVRTRVEPINRDIELLVSEELSPAARSQQLAEFGAESINEARQQNERILGRIPRHKIFVDGREGAALASVRPDGVIIAEFDLLNDVLLWIATQLETHSPVKTGQYKRAHILFADGREVHVGAVIPDAEEYLFINTMKYARKIETGSSSQAPEGVYQAVATLAAQTSKFGNIASIRFEPFRGFVEGSGGNKSENRNPAISVKVRR